MADIKAMKREFLIITIILFNVIALQFSKAQSNIRFGICADVHKDLIPDADKRLQTFIS